MGGVQVVETTHRKTPWLSNTEPQTTDRGHVNNLSMAKLEGNWVGKKKEWGATRTSTGKKPPPKKPNPK